MNMNCLVGTLGRLLAGFSDTKRKISCDMGFSGLFFTTGKTLPRMLSYWLCTRVDVSKRMLVTVDGKEFQLNPIQVNWVLGLPYGTRPVPVGQVVDKEEESRLFETLKTTTAGDKKGITRNTLQKWMEEDPCTDPSLWQKVFILVLMNPLYASASHMLQKKFLSAAMVADEAQHYNWCVVVLDELINSLKLFSNHFYAGTIPAGCGGCTLFLAIMYLDRLNRLPVSWGETPRIKVWTTKLMNEAARDDRTATGDFWKLGVDSQMAGVMCSHVGGRKAGVMCWRL